MTFGPTSNRLAGLWDDPPAGPTPRSPAQQQASRRNGAQSHGPNTDAGKARSRLNSLKHGLLASAITPPTDRRGDDQLYRDVRQALVEGFNPVGFTPHALIDTLAADYIDLARVRRLIEAVQRPPALTVEEAKQLERAEHLKRQLMHLETVASAASGGAWPCPPEVVTSVADILATLMTGMEADVAPAAPNDPDGLDPLPDEELRPLLKLLEDLGPRRQLWAQPEVIEALLRRKRIGVQDLTRLMALLDRAITRLRELLGSQRGTVAQVEQRDAAFELQLAQDPGRLMLLRRYQSRIEHAIERKVRQLGRE
ncbi:MAG: hypothetical protein K8S99_03685 [Planctomycetes bacterium]|nr:hypothetical protein [Planctomycetota bacterium]